MVSCMVVVLWTSPFSIEIRSVRLGRRIALLVSSPSSLNRIVIEMRLGRTKSVYFNHCPLRTRYPKKMVSTLVPFKPTPYGEMCSDVTISINYPFRVWSSLLVAPLMDSSRLITFSFCFLGRRRRISLLRTWCSHRARHTASTATEICSDV